MRRFPLGRHDGSVCVSIVFDVLPGGFEVVERSVEAFWSKPEASELSSTFTVGPVARFRSDGMVEIVIDTSDYGSLWKVCLVHLVGLLRGEPSVRFVGFFDCVADRFHLSADTPENVAARQAAAARRAQGGNIPTMTAAAVDQATGKAYVGFSGFAGPVRRELRVPALSKTLWEDAGFCAEAHACTVALEDGAALGDLQVAVARTHTAWIERHCRNCSLWVPGRRG